MPFWWNLSERLDGTLSHSLQSLQVNLKPKKTYVCVFLSARLYCLISLFQCATWGFGIVLTHFLNVNIGVKKIQPDRNQHAKILLKGVRIINAIKTKKHKSGNKATLKSYYKQEHAVKVIKGV